MCKMGNPVERNCVCFFLEKKKLFESQNVAYNDSSKIFGNGICCRNISSSKESVAVDIDDAIK